MLQELLSQNAHCINLLSATTVYISSLAELANGCKVAMETDFNLHYRFLSVGHWAELQETEIDYEKQGPISLQFLPC